MVLLTTAIALSLQWIFYSQPTDGSTLPGWQVVLFASIVPVGLNIMARHHESRARDIADNLQLKVADAQKRAGQLETELITNQALAQAQEARGAKERLETITDKIRSKLEVARASAAEALLQIDLLQGVLDEAQTILRAW